jgi:prepilin-type N-terminal cleavage/methylation domain-containing protein
MKKNLLTKIRNRKGFTLAELLIVVAIIGDLHMQNAQQKF